MRRRPQFEHETPSCSSFTFDWHRGQKGPTATLVRPVLVVDAGEAGERFGGEENEGHVPLDAGALGVLGLEGAEGDDLDAVAAVDAVEAFFAEVAGEDGGGVVAGLGEEAAGGDVFGDGDEVVDKDGDVGVVHDG